MKTMKTIMLASFLGLSTLAVAQERNEDKIKKELNLSVEQTEKLKQIHEQFKPEFREIMMDKSLTRDDKSKKLQALRAKEREASKAILSPEQIARFEELKKRKE
ncbi:hypothetical protein UJ101_01195 [Flavobacteriaceae bacterium UJ101]|nr:hypothetical protein UJ101_01195 [Flavobacteriaceae bacterium UJ101]